MLPLTATATPADQAELAAIAREAFVSATPLYPIGGGTALDFGVVPKRPGLGVSLAGLTRVVDYPSRDMTITVEAGIAIAELAAVLARQGQRLPIDASQGAAATLGGVVATNFSGPRRYGQGTIRDYVIGISAVDGRGVAFKGGGRVVKNVAGYDFCKLLTGSLGTLAIISQVTLKVKPLPQATAWLTCDVPNFSRVECLLAALADSKVTPAAIEVVVGPHWQTEQTPMLSVNRGSLGVLLVGFEGTKSEVDWQVEQLRGEWQAQGAPVRGHHADAAEYLGAQLSQFGSGQAPLVLKINVRPSAAVSIMKLLLDIDPKASLESHAGNGIVIAAFSEFSLADASKILIQRLQPAAMAAGGNVVVWSCSGGELTRQAVWGASRGDAEVMRAVKRQFDPKGLLNPDRFLYGTM
ncbi:MAG TPA: FAD-binding oxidoreductase [Pirellulales bacterium]|nr:FAD-binding oxidoreductase [Pirellulales bacterium]